MTRCAVCLNEGRGSDAKAGTRRTTMCAGGWPIYRTLCDEHAPAVVARDAAYTGDVS